MTANKAYKRAVRARMAETGETYTQAARRLDESTVAPDGSLPHDAYIGLVADALATYDAAPARYDTTTSDGLLLEAYFTDWPEDAVDNETWPEGVVLGWDHHSGWVLIDQQADRTIYPLDEGCVGVYANPGQVAASAANALRGHAHTGPICTPGLWDSRPLEAAVQAWEHPNPTDPPAGQELDNGVAVSPLTRPVREDFGGHEFEYESRNDLFKCVYCQEYEIVVRADDGTIAPCKGLADYGDDTERVYLLVTTNPDPRMPECGTHLAWQIGKTRIGRVPRYASRDARMLVESAPSVVDELEQRIEAMTIAVVWGQARVVVSIERLTAEQGRRFIADNYAAAVAKYGADEVPPPEFGASGV